MLSRKPPAVVFLPDEKTLACTIREQLNGAIHILTVPKSRFELAGVEGKRSPETPKAG